MSSHIARRVVISGRVQGVNFRAWTREQAERRGLSGWVQNMPDGSVEAQFAGPPEQVEDMIAACRKGPLDARVDDIEVIELDEAPPSEGFRVNR